MNKRHHSQALMRNRPMQEQVQTHGLQLAYSDGYGDRVAPRAQGAFAQAFASACALIRTKDWEGAEATIYHWSPQLTQYAASRYAEMHYLMGMVKRGQQIQYCSNFATQDRRSWHFIVTGGLLLSAQQPGSQPNSSHQARSLQDSLFHHEADLHSFGLSRLQMLLSLWQLRIPRVLMLPDTTSAALARQAAQVLNCPLETWAPGTQQPGLIPVSELGQLPRSLQQDLRSHQSGQILWSQRSSAADPFAPDLTTTMEPFSSGYSSSEEAAIYAAPSGDEYFEEDLDELDTLTPETDPLTVPLMAPASAAAHSSLYSPSSRIAETTTDQADQAELLALARAIRPGEYGAAALRNQGDRLPYVDQTWFH